MGSGYQVVAALVAGTPRTANGLLHMTGFDPGVNQDAGE